ncbi:uncharacterized protein K02A2.6-like [Ruditapes philippinarum]|uniref:uncharacterized protein K02A2.6-like n=1 Tax=Ruditapes philippinarum TaxID=129788 RepID=UPI00295B0A86|nr:uncharacterized protein K02A2.6-like [Ruditapes philippinarum]
MAALIGHLSGFDGNSESWTCYQERLEQYFLVNEIDDEKKVPALLTLLGEKTYGLLRNLTSPDKPSTQSYDDLCELLNKHLNPKPLIIAERFRFHKRNQAAGESVNDYVTTQRKLAEHCDFQASLNNTLRDRLVCGLKDEHIQRKLLSMEDLSLKKAVETAVAMETATRDAAELQSLTASVNKVEKRKPSRRVEHRPRQKPATANSTGKQNGKCIHCGKDNHASFKCRFKNAICHACNAHGHIKSICLKARARDVHAMNNDDVPVMSINSVTKGSSRKITITPEIDDRPLQMEVDTGSAVSLMSREEFQKCFGNVTLDKPTSVLKTYSGEEIQQAGTKLVNVRYNGQSKSLKLCIVMGNGPALFGRDWMNEIILDWSRIVHVNSIDDHSTQTRIADIMKRYESVFSDGIGKVKDIKATLSVKENASPKFVKARPVPYSLKPKIEKELDILEEQGIITKVNTSEWATPIVPVVKSSGGVRICGDFKVTVNQAINVDKYPLPRIEDIFANLANGKKYSKLDLRQAYLQLECDDKTKEMLTINTHKGLYSYNRLTYGVSSAPAIWQRTIDQILQGIPGVQCILDDMVITGENDQAHLNNLETVVQRLSKYGLKVNKEKCQFFQERITYCGHEIDENGLWKCNDKVDSILNTPRPQNVTSLRAYLGLLNYYHRFLNNLATVIKPLNQLLEKGRKFVWTKECQNAFAKSKDLITSEPVLTHYDPKLPVRLATDASPVGISAILSHVMPDGSEKPIAFASRSLSKSERMYAQVQREATAIYWAVHKYYPYLYGRKFTLITDCQALLSIFSPSKGIPATSAARIQRYAVYLSGFDYDIEYKSTKKHTNVDGMSRLPAPSILENESNFEEVFFNEQFDKLPITSAQIKRETQREPILSRVYENVNKGWSLNLNDPVLKGYHTRRNELTIQRGCLMWGIRVVIPEKLRGQVLDLLHCSHSGIVKMKNLARSYVWWPGIDSDIEHMVRQCQGCQMQQKMPVKVKLHP